MRFIEQASIKRKQMLIVMLITCVALLLACLAFGAYEVVTFRRTMLQNVHSLAEIVGNNSASALDFDDPKSAEETLRTLKAEPNIVGACIYDKNGRIFAQFDQSGDRRMLKPPPVQPEGYSFNRNDLTLFAPINYKGDVIGTVYIASDMKVLYARLERYGAIAGGVFVVTMLVAFGLSMRLQRLVSDPILQLVQTTRMVARDKDYSIRVARHSEDEIGVLIDGFNEMLTQIQERDAVLQHAQSQLEQRVRERTQELASSLSLVHATLESTADAILVADGTGKPTNWNEKFIQMWRIPKEVLGAGDERKMMELALAQVKHPDKYLAKVEELYGRLEMESFDVLELKDGRTVERYSKPQRIGDRCVGRVWSFRDVSERRRAETELAAERDLLRTLLENSPDMIYFKDRESRFLRSSKTHTERMGAKRKEDVVGKTDFDFFAEEHARPAFSDEQAIIQTGQPLIGKIEKETYENGKVSWVLTSKMPLRNEMGEIIGTFGISKDISPIKEAETRLEQAHRQLLETSRMAGMAEVATSVLHNVGNVLNSVNVSCSMVTERVHKSKVANLSRAVALINEHEQNLPGFFADDPKGRQLPSYLTGLAAHLTAEQEEILRELSQLSHNVDHIKEIVAMQQSYSKVSGVRELLPPQDLVEDSLRMNGAALDRHQVKVVREFGQTPPVMAEKHKVLQILINLLRNAKYACDDSGRPDKQVILRTEVCEGDRVRISIIDNGVGIPKENLTRIFEHGFTTRKEGHGFGLHSGALAAKDLGGSLRVLSDGPGRGACFILELPCEPVEALV